MTVSSLSTAKHPLFAGSAMEEAGGDAPILSRGPSGLDAPTFSRNVSTMSGLGLYHADAMVSAFPMPAFGSCSADQSQFYQPMVFPGSMEMYLPSNSRDVANFNGEEMAMLASSKSVDQAPLMAFGSRSLSYGAPSNSVDRMVTGMPVAQNFPANLQVEDVHVAADTLHEMTPPHAPFQPSAPARQQEPSRTKPAEESVAGRKRKRTVPVVVVEQPSSRGERKRAAPPPQEELHSSRGAHVKNRPEMQKQARDGQQHWAKMVKQKRDEWGAMPAHSHTEAFKAQMDMCAQRNIKSQKECLIRFLHISAAANVVKPNTPFAPLKESTDAGSFLGWTGFTVSTGRGAAFRQGVEAMFQEEHPKQNTVQNLFRRAGLVPEDWDRAWDGAVPFRFTSPAPMERKKS